MRANGKWLIAATLLMLLTSASVMAQQPQADLRVFTYPKLLIRGDVLQDGEGGQGIPIYDDTQFLWADLQPGSRFVHDSAYILISADRIRILRGQWWPILNGRSAFGTPPWFPETDVLVRNPVIVPNRYPDPSTPSEPLVEDIEVRADPFALRQGDVLMDASWVFPIRIEDQTMFVWVDFHPTAKFAHKTGYVLIGPRGVDVLDGQWWPELNGRRVLYGEDNDWGVMSPFDLFFIPE